MRLRLKHSPALSIVIVGTHGLDRTLKSLAAQTVDTEQLEVLAGDLRTGLRAARGRMLTVVASGAVFDRSYAERMLSASVADVLVPGRGTAAAEPTGQILDVALTAPGVAVRTRIARAVPLDDDLPLASMLLHRARSVGRSRRSLVDVDAPPPEGSDLLSVAGDYSPLSSARMLIDAFSRLESIDARQTGFRRALFAPKRAIAIAIGRAIAADPSIRHTVVSSVDERALRGFSFRAMNIESADTLAVVYAFPPFLDTGGFVVSRRLGASDVVYDVLTQDMSSRRPRDERSLDLASRNLGRRMVIRAPISSGNWTHIEQFCTSGMAQVEAREDSVGAYKNLYTRSMWLAPSVLGAWYKARHPNVPWTAELSDPLAVRPNGELRPNPIPPSDIMSEINDEVRRRGLPEWSGDLLFEAVEWMVFSLADRVVFTNENQRDFMLARIPNADLADRVRKVSAVAPHPVPEAGLYNVGRAVEVDPTQINLAYFGNFYTVRGVQDLLDPLAALTPEEQRRVRLHIFTTAVEKTQAEVAAHDAAPMISVRPALPYFDFLASTKVMDWLVLADAHRPETFSVNPYLPSKLADYRGSGKPIWGIVDAGSVLSRAELVVTSTLGDVAEAVRALREQILRS